LRNYLIRRLLYLVPVIIGVVTIVFLLIHLIPGDPVDMMLGETAMGVEKDELRHQLYLDKPLVQQYGIYIGNLLKGDLGRSIYSREPVAEIILSRFPATLQLASFALLISLLVAIPVGIIAAAKQYSLFDSGTMFFSMIAVSMPNFWLGPLLILIFAYHLDLFPISGRSGFASIILPACTLGLSMAAVLSRMVRSCMLEVIQEEYIKTAMAKGVGRMAVLSKHALRNALIPVITLVGIQSGNLLAGSIITEKIFSWPGVGQEIIDTITKRDYPLVQGCVLLISLSYVIVNLLTDIMYKVVDPRVKYDKK
jgi:peptide/nickel transport system permease protein